MIRKKAARKTDAYVSRETIDDSESDSDDNDERNRNEVRHRNDSDGDRDDLRHSFSSQGDGSRHSVTLSDSTNDDRGVSICQDENLIRQVS
jgi:hypothetical protein